MQRQGVCSHCGQCCGADGSPEQRNPWPRTWPEALRNWEKAYLEEQIPLFKVFVHPSKGGELYGRVRIGNKWYRWIWVPGHGLCEDLRPWGDTSSFSEECPLLMDDPGDGTRPCALVGTEYEYIWARLCQPEPPMEKNVDEVAVWQSRHPLCSYAWE